MSGPGREAVNRGLYNADNYADAADTIRRIGNCHEHRLEQVALGVAGRAVVAAKLALDLVEDATPAVLRAMAVQLTTPELRPAVPVVVVSSCTCGVMSGGAPDRRVSCQMHGAAELERQHNVPAGSVTQPTEEGVGGLATPTPPALVQRILDLVRVYGDARADYARRAVDENTVERAFGAVENAVEPLAIGALIGELDGRYRGGAL